MKKRNGYTAVDLIIVIAVLGIVTFFTISKVSYALSDDKSQLYSLEVEYIETQAKAYANTIIEELKQGPKTITVNNLISDNYLQADDESGKIYDPRDEALSLNDKKISLTYNESTNEVTARYLDD